MRRQYLHRSVVVAFVGVATLGLAGCGDDPVAFDALGAWARPTPGGSTVGVLYLTVTSDEADALIGVEVAADVAGSVELHATMVEGEDGEHHHGSGDAGSGDAPPMVGMEPVESLPVEAGGSLVLESGGNHAMLVDLPDPLVDGERFPATLRFSSGRSLTIEVAVTNTAPDDTSSVTGDR